MATVVSWRDVAARREVVQQSAKALAAGAIVAFPTETVYNLAASALVPDAVDRLMACRGRPEGRPLTIGLRAGGELRDWVPGLSPAGVRLTRRCWPGPVVFVFAEGLSGGVASRLPNSTGLDQGQTLAARVPAHEAILETMRHLAGPLVLGSAQRPGDPWATSSQHVLEAFADQVDFVIDDGPSRYARPATVVQVAGESWNVIREGVVTADTLQRLMNRVILFVCTGNTCRSPLAEGLCKKLLAEQLGCQPEELSARGFLVLSAGLSAMMGHGATPEAVAVAQHYGVDLIGHASQPLTRGLLQQADAVFAMTYSHLRALQMQFPHADEMLQSLSPRGEDIADPIGSGPEVYAHCAAQIRQCLEQRLPLLMGPGVSVT